MDIRGRWGGAPLDAAEIFVGGTPNVEMVMPEGEIFQANFRWTKPLIAVIGHETRSGMEIMAYSLKNAGIPLAGSNTRGAVLGGRAFILEDGSFLLIPALDIKVDGQRLEGTGIAPDFSVDFILEYSRGYDPQLETAINKVMEIIHAL
ncbi:MAG: S41 family peptidase [Treponema sp.]|nr:S41 family peptidase [Treponema sp.]